jgi:hypothetical protein
VQQVAVDMQLVWPGCLEMSEGVIASTINPTLLLLLLLAVTFLLPSI